MAKKKYYAWVLPSSSGICESWDECKAKCNGQRKEKHQGFTTYEEAWAFAYPGIPMPSQEEKPAFSSDEIDEKVNSVENDYESVKPLVSTDIAVSDDVNEYCKRYGFSHLSEQQKKAIQCVDGQTLLFAVPGSGKTTVIIARTGYMVFAKHISPSSIISLTFTKAAAVEMSNRFKDHFKTENAPDFRTIHSLCFSVILPRLKSLGYSFPAILLGADPGNDEEGQAEETFTTASVFRALFKSLKINTKDFETDMEAAQCVITGIKNSVMPPQEYENKILKIGGKEVTAGKLFSTYQEILQSKNCMDYDDLLKYSYEGLKNYPSLIDTLRQRYLYWNIDEAQDNSRLQFMLFDLLCGKDGNIFMVGDDDQSIYGFRGANPELLLKFGNRSNVNVLLMDYNYRSDSDIVKSARGFIEYNVNRENKEMLAFSKEPGELFIPRILKTETEQYCFIVDAAKKALTDSSSLAVLYRRNVSSFPLIVYMHKNGIPYEANKGLAELLRGKYIKVLWRVMDFINSPCSLKAFNACRINLGIHLSKEAQKDLKETYKEAFEPVLCFLRRKYIADQDEKSADLITDIISKLEYLRKMRPTDAVKEIIKDIYVISTENIGDRLRIYSFLSACDLYDSIAEFVNDLHSIIAIEKKKSEEADPTDFEENNSAVITESKPLITLSSMHSSKGREFDRVIIIDTFDEIMPGQQRDEALIYDPEEERRLFYVAVTRAAHRLDLITVDKYHGNSEIVSRFVAAFAFICEQNSNTVDILKNTVSERIAESGEYLIEPQVYYAVRNGRKTGIFTTWSECQEQTDAFSHADFKKFYTKSDAEKYISLTAIQPTIKLNLSEIDKHIIDSVGVAFNYPMDIPESVNNAVHNYFNVNSIQELSQDRLNALRISGNYIYSKDGPTYYRNKTDSYLLIYMPVNYYKVWKPLYQLAANDKLPIECKTLELGVGPGTATLGLINFYKTLADNNPDTKFSLDITAVEREPEFESSFTFLTNSYIKSRPQNLSISVKFICGDALNYRADYGNNFNLIIESNMLNLSEDASDEAIYSFIQTVNKSISSEGYIISIEPGKKENQLLLNKMADKVLENHSFIACVEPSLLATDVSQISLYNEAVTAGLRSTRKAEHWFSYVILEKRAG